MLGISCHGTYVKRLYNMQYCKCSKNLNIFFLSFLKMLVNMSEIHKMLVRLSNGEDPDGRSSLIWVCIVFYAFLQVTSVQNLENLHLIIN